MAATKQRKLSRESIVSEAMALADEEGIDALTIRRLATRLGVGAMSVYHYVTDKDDLIDAMVDRVYTEIELPPTDRPWRDAILARYRSARAVLGRHPWAPPLMESRRSPGPANLAHHEAVLACLRRGGLTLELTAHAYAILDSLLYGFAMQEANLPGMIEGDFQMVAEMIAQTMPADTYPHLSELTFEYVLQPGYDFGSSFEVGLALILDGIERLGRT